MSERADIVARAREAASFDAAPTWGGKALSNWGNVRDLLREAAAFIERLDSGPGDSVSVPRAAAQKALHELQRYPYTTNPVTAENVVAAIVALEKALAAAPASPPAPSDPVAEDYHPTMPTVRVSMPTKTLSGTGVASSSLLDPVLEERERCARIADAKDTESYPGAWRRACRHIAETIRLPPAPKE